MYPKNKEKNTENRVRHFIFLYHIISINLLRFFEITPQNRAEGDAHPGRKIWRPQNSERSVSVMSKILTPIVSRTVLSFLYQLANNFQSLPIAFVFRTENSNKFRKAERTAEVKFEPKVKPNSESNTTSIFINTCVIFFVKGQFSILICCHGWIS